MIIVKAKFINMVYKYLTLYLIFMVSMFYASNAQTKDSTRIGKNGIYTEFYLIRSDFNSGFFSVNYERLIGKKNKTNLRIGIYPDFKTVISFPITLSWITAPSKNRHFEYGIGAIYRIEHYKNPYIPSREYFYDMPALWIPLMYRYQKNTGWFFRGGANLFVSWPTTLSPSASLGYKF